MCQPQHEPITANRWPDDDWQDAEYERYEAMTSEPARAAARVMLEDEPIEDLPF